MGDLIRGRELRMWRRLWSLIPGSTVMRFTSLGLDVRSRSRVFSPLVGHVIAWFRLKSRVRSRNCLDSLDGDMIGTESKGQLI